MKPLEFIKQCTGCAQIDCIEPFLEPTEHRGKHLGRFFQPSLLASQVGQTHRASKLPRLRILSSRNVDAFFRGRLGVAYRPGAGEQRLAPSW